MREPEARRISIILPEPWHEPVGGFLSAYCYANEFARQGHRVTVLHPWRASRPSRTEMRRYVRRISEGGRSAVKWFKFDESVRVWLLPWLRRELLPPADLTLLTAWQTSAWLAKPSIFGSGELAQIVYDYEMFMSADVKTRAAIRASLSREDVNQVAGSTAVKTMLTDFGRPGRAVVAPGCDVSRWRLKRPISGRPPVIGFALRDEPHKAVGLLIEALEGVRYEYPDAQFICFGRSRVATPEWVESRGYLTDTELCDFYNACSVFVVSSDYEGYGLPAVEAMACGAALVSTRNGGVEDYARDEQTAILTPIRDAVALTQAISRLLKDETFRVALAARAATSASKRTWRIAARDLAAATGILDQR